MNKIKQTINSFQPNMPDEIYPITLQERSSSKRYETWTKLTGLSKVSESKKSYVTVVNTQEKLLDLNAKMHLQSARINNAQRTEGSYEPKSVKICMEILRRMRDN